jgi:hypothetical protein
MLTISEIISSRKQLQKKLDAGELRRLPYKKAFIYGRLSTPSQVRDSRESVREIAQLVALSRKDGFQTKLDPDEIEALLLEMTLPMPRSVQEEGAVIVDIRDLGISGQLPFEKRDGLLHLKERVENGEVGAVYLTEGVSRLSRDQDKIIPYQLLKLLKEHRCRIRTPEGIWNPAIGKDWQELAEEFEDAIEECRVMAKRMFRRKKQKASRGEFVGEPVPAGFIVPVIGQKPNGQYEYGKLQPYGPHTKLVIGVLHELIKHNGSIIKTVQTLIGLTFPYFPKDLAYMERLTALRRCPKMPTGYKITPRLVVGLATNLKLIGIWQWGNNEPILHNHEPAVPAALFLKAYELVAVQKKPKGRAANFEPLDWAGLLWCLNDPEPRRISSHNADGRYVCDYEYQHGKGHSCLDITSRFIDEPLTTEVLRQLDFTPCADEVLEKLEADVTQGKLEELQRGRAETTIEESIKKWQSLLQTCVDSETGQVDRDKESFYWDQIRKEKAQLEDIRSRSINNKYYTPDHLVQIRNFLRNLPHNWVNYPGSLRNRLLKLIIDRVELYHNKERIEATIIWKVGLKQRITIHRPPARGRRDDYWTLEEDGLLRMLYSASPVTVILAALPKRSWKAITERAFRLHVSRKRTPDHSASRVDRRPWTLEEDERLKLLYEAGEPLSQLSKALNRTVDAIQNRAAAKCLTRLSSNKRQNPTLTWETHDLSPFHYQSSRGGLRG